MNWDKIPHTKNVLQQQCEIANIDFNEIDFDSDCWFQEETWTSKNEESFKKWVVHYLKNNIKARRELCRIPELKGKKHLEKWLDGWNLMYGFRIKDD